MNAPEAMCLEPAQADTNAAWHARRLAATPRGVAVLGNFFIDRAKNAELWDIEGHRFIDFAGGIGVLNTGHLHPRVQEAIARQLERFTHSCYQVVPYTAYVRLAERLNALVPIEDQKKTAFFSTGAEAVENAVKIARAATRRSGVIAFQGGFHGRSLFAVSLTGKVMPYKAGFGPYAPEVYHMPYPSAGMPLQQLQDTVANLFKCDIEPSRVAAVIFEPVQGEGGFNIIDQQAVRWLRELCDAEGMLLIADEVQSGFARTGKHFAMEHFGVSPDLLTMAKSLAGGMTLSAVCGRADVMDAPNPGGLGGTYAGHPLAVAAAHAVLDVIDDDRLCARAQLLGERLAGRLKLLGQGCPLIADIRALGAMVACDIVDPLTDAPSAELARRVQQEAMRRGLIVLTCGSAGNTIRFLFPLTIEDELFEEAMGIFATSALQVAQTG